MRLILAGGFIAIAVIAYWIYSANVKDSNLGSNQQSSNTAMSPNLVKANELTQEVFRFVELVETKQMTQEEANRLSNPVKVELQNVRSMLSPEELVVNDSIRKVLGNIMVDNVMQWRKENLPPVEEDE